MTTNQTIDGVPREFVREGRYIVVRPDHEDDLRTERLRNYIEEMCFHTPDCVVVEADWPEYEKVWGMIEARVTGRQTELDSALATIAHLRDDLEGTRLLAADQLLKIKQQRAEIYRLKSGKGEPAAYISKASLSFLMQRKDVERTSWRLNLSTHVSGDETEPLYAEQPAPVAVVLPTQEDFERFIIRRDGSVNVSVLGKSRFYNDPTIDREYFVWLTCLDEVTRLKPSL